MTRQVYSTDIMLEHIYIYMYMFLFTVKKKRVWIIASLTLKVTLWWYPIHGIYGPSLSQRYKNMFEENRTWWQWIIEKRKGVVCRGHELANALYLLARDLNPVTHWSWAVYVDHNMVEPTVFVVPPTPLKTASCFLYKPVFPPNAFWWRTVLAFCLMARILSWTQQPSIETRVCWSLNHQGRWCFLFSWPNIIPHFYYS